MSGHDYSHVNVLKDMVEAILDGLLAGDDIESVLKSLKTTSKEQPKRVLSKQKLFTCQVCNFQTRIGTALKTHVTKTHGESKATPEHIIHKDKQNIKRTISVKTCDEKNCDLTFSCQENLSKHKKISMRVLIKIHKV